MRQSSRRAAIAGRDRTSLRAPRRRRASARRSRAQPNCWACCAARATQLARARPGRRASRSNAQRRSRAGRDRRPARRTRRRDGGRQAADVGRDDRRAARLRLDRDQPERLVVRRHDDQGGRPVPVDELGPARPAATNRTTSATPSDAASSTSACGRVEPGARRAADDGDDQPLAQLRVAGEQLGRGADQDVGRLQRLDPADEDQHDRVRREPERARAAACVARAEDVEVDTRGDHRGPGRGRRRTGRSSCCASSSVLATIRSAASTTCSSPITRAAGSGASPSASAGVLDLRHRVHRVHERHAPAVARQRTDLAGEPVVRVDRGRSSPGCVGRLGAQHLAGERAQLARAARPWSGPRTDRRRRAGP